MKLSGSVAKQEDAGDRARITVTNIRAVGDAGWQPYHPELGFDVPIKRAKIFPLGRTVEIVIKPK